MNPMINQTLPANLRDLRAAHKFTLEEIAEQIGVTRQAVAKWENGESLPDLSNCAALADLYGVTVDALLHHDRAAAGVGIPPKGKHMFGPVTVGERGQIVIPKRARDLFGIRPGDQLMLLGDETQGRRGLALVDPDVFLASLAEWERTAHRRDGEA